MILVGRRGLCRYNGVFRIKNFDNLPRDRKAFIDITNSDPNDCYFDNVEIENKRNQMSEKAFFHVIDLRMTLNLNNDDRFSFQAPTVSSVSPYIGPVEGGQEIKIGGMNFGFETYDILDITVKGVMCADFVQLSPTLISCVTRPSIILGPGFGNVKIRLKNGLKSPLHTCNVYEYRGAVLTSVDIFQKTVRDMEKVQDLPIYNNAHFYDQGIALIDPLVLYREKIGPPPSPAVFKEHEYLNGAPNIAQEQVNMMVHNTMDGLNKLVVNSEPLVEKLGFKHRRFENLVENLLPPP